jgi:hypothetical protein
MLKKVLFTWVLATMVMGLSLFVLPHPTRVFAADATQPGDISSQEYTFDLNPIAPPGTQRASWLQKGANYFAERAITVMATLAGSFAVLLMVFGGFQMITSVGDEGYEKGKKKILYAIIGLAAVLGAYILVTTVQILIKSING